MGLVLDRLRSPAALRWENALLRKQLEVACRQVRRPRLRRCENEQWLPIRGKPALGSRFVKDRRDESLDVGIVDVHVLIDVIEAAGRSLTGAQTADERR